MKTLKLTVDDYVAIIAIDQPGSGINTVTLEMITEFHDILDEIEQDNTIRAAILYSAKKDRFIAGADIQIIKSFKIAQKAFEFSRKHQQLLNRIYHLGIPVIAAIHGPALGSGLETAIACHYRIATDHPVTRFALPDVKLGLCPAGGGTQHLPRLVGINEALSMLLSGQNIYARRAKEINLVNELIHADGLIRAAKNVAEKLTGEKSNAEDYHNLNGSGNNSLVSGTRDRQKISNSKLSGRAVASSSARIGFTENNPIMRRLIYSKAEKDIQVRTRGLYPAPKSILNCVKYGLQHGMEKGLGFETETFEYLAGTPESQQLIDNYILIQRSRKNPSESKPVPVSHIGLLGAGLMGSGITSVSIQNGFQITLKDRDFSSAIRGKKTVWEDLEPDVNAGAISEFERDRLLSGIYLTDQLSDLQNLPLIIEAVFEDLSVKHAVLKETEPILPDNGIFATNTSAIPIAEIAKAAKRPERIIGMHYFSPVQKMPLLEVIRSEITDEEVVSTACDVGIRQGKHVIVVSDSPGFYVTRILMPMLNEALLLLEEGADIRIVDTAMKNFGFPVGPITLIDEAGIDVVLHITETMNSIFKKREIRISQTIHRLYEAGYSGRKNLNGFYEYRNKKKVLNEDIYHFFGGSGRKDFILEEIQERISLMMINEAVVCLQEDILQHPNDGDTGAMLGMGFPPVLGGPFRYIDRLGARRIWNRLEYLRGIHGDRFKPAGILSDHIRSNKRFYA
ncbi:MAG: 3-hydroxyacyl-CoA dehydrogenase NAD-binding domain-containing protein [Balneolales bacterium]